jgi:hypothetical protein
MAVDWGRTQVVMRADWWASTPAAQKAVLKADPSVGVMVVVTAAKMVYPLVEMTAETSDPIQAATMAVAKAAK